MTADREPGGRPDLDIDRGEGATPAMNRPGPKADDDVRVTPGNRGWVEPANEAPQDVARAVRRDPDAGDADGAAVRPPSDARAVDPSR